ncbi:MAG: hypothetical protein ACPGC8_04180 [Flavobacteriaceae bacterium]
MIEEGLDLIKLYRRIFLRQMVSYEKDIHNIWRLKFSYYTTGFQHKKKPKKIFLEGTFVASQHLPRSKIITQQKRFPYQKVLSLELLMQQDKKTSSKLNFNQRIAKFLIKFRTTTGIEIQPFLFKENTHHFTPLNKTLTTEIENSLTLTYYNKLEYILNNQWGIGYTSVVALKNRIYKSNSLNINYHRDLSRRNLTHLSLGLDVGYRKLRKRDGVHLFEENFNFNKKNFDSGFVTLYSETREWALNPSLGIIFRINPFIHLGLRASYFIPFKFSNGIYAHEEKEFWFWNRAKAFQKSNSIQEKGTIKNQYSTGIYLTFNF